MTQMNAQQNAEIALNDGLALTPRAARFVVVVTMSGNPRHQSEPLPEKEARDRMAKIIKVYTTDLKYKQTAGKQYTTLKNGKFEVQIRVVAVCNE